MSTGKRFSLSLLISTLLFTGFSFVAFSGLFPWLELQFYSPKIVSDLQAQLTTSEAQIKDWEASQVSKFRTLLADPSFAGVYSPTFDRKRYETAKLFLQGQKFGGAVRIVDSTRKKLHFSTVERDFATKTDKKAIYFDYDVLRSDAANAEQLPVLEGQDLAGLSKVFVGPQGRMFQFVVPFTDSQTNQAGWALLDVLVEDLRLSLLEKGNPLASQTLLMATPEVALFWLTDHPETPVYERVKSQVRAGVLPPVQKLAQAAATGGQTLSLVAKSSATVLVPDSLLALDASLKAIVLIAFFTVVFLISFLLFNLRGDPVSVAVAQIRRLQIQVLQNYLDEKNQDKIQGLREELFRHSDEIKRDIRKNLGRVRKKDAGAIDQFIDKNWQEILDLLDKRAPEAPPGSAQAPEPTITLTEFRQLLQEALRSLPVGVSPASRPAPSKATSKDDVEDLDELEEIEEVEELGELEEVEELDDVEELEEAEEVGELELEVNEAEAIRAPSTSEELEELEDGDMDIQDAELLEELPAHSASGDHFPGYNARQQDGPLAMLEVQGDADGELEELEELEELDELEELEEDGSQPTYSNTSLTLDVLEEAWTLPAEEVFENNDDVVSLRDDLYLSATTPDDEFGHLVGEVTGDKPTPFMPLEDSDVPAIIRRVWRWSGAGFEWERFAGGDSEVDLFRALSDAVTAFDAFTAAILVKEGDTWIGTSSVGFSDSGKDALNFGPDKVLGGEYLGRRELHVLDGGRANPVLREAFHEKDLRFLRTILCVPLLFRKEPAWLLLGLRRDPGNLLQVLEPRTIS